MTAATRPVSSAQARALDDFCQSLSAAAGGAPADPGRLRAGLEAMCDVARAAAGPSSGTWRAALDEDPGQGMQVLELADTAQDQCVRLYLDVGGAAYVGSWQTPATGDVAQALLFDVRQSGASGWAVRVGDGQMEKTLALGARPSGFAWAERPRFTEARDAALGPLQNLWSDVSQAVAGAGVSEAQDWAADKLADGILDTVRPRQKPEASRPCAACGHINPPENQFCSQCGARLTASEPAAYCGRCGAPLQPGQNACPRCGQPV